MSASLTGAVVGSVSDEMLVMAVTVPCLDECQATPRGAIDDPATGLAFAPSDR
jgi:hypothetical protein